MTTASDLIDPVKLEESVRTAGEISGKCEPVVAQSLRDGMQISTLTYIYKALYVIAQNTAPKTDA